LKLRTKLLYGALDKYTEGFRRKVAFHEEWAGKIAIISNVKKNPKDVYEMWKSRDWMEKAFDVLQNELQVDAPYISKEAAFKGYIFASFISLYLIIKS